MATTLGSWIADLDAIHETARKEYAADKLLEPSTASLAAALQSHVANPLPQSALTANQRSLIQIAVLQYGSLTRLEFKSLLRRIASTDNETFSVFRWVAMTGRRRTGHVGALHVEQMIMHCLTEFEMQTLSRHRRDGSMTAAATVRQNLLARSLFNQSIHLSGKSVDPQVVSFVKKMLVHISRLPVTLSHEDGKRWMKRMEERINSLRTKDGAFKACTIKLLRSVFYITRSEVRQSAPVQTAQLSTKGSKKRRPSTECAAGDDDAADRLRCPVCMDASKDACLPCGHLFCMQCAQTVGGAAKPANRVCPVCRKKFKSSAIKPVFL